MPRNNMGGKPGLRVRRENALKRLTDYVAEFKTIPTKERDQFVYGKKSRTYDQQLAYYEQEIARLKAKL